MIKTHLSFSIGELVTEIRAGGKVAVPVPGTPLEVLNNTIPFIGLMEGDASWACSAVVAASQELTVGDTESGKTHHCVELDALIKSSAKRVRALLDLARNYVNPMVEQIVTDINAEYTRRLEKVAVNLEVITSKQSPLFKNESIRNLVTTRVNKDVGAKSMRPTHFSDFISDKIAYVSSAIPGIEAEAALYFGQRGSEYLDQVFEGYFKKDSQWESVVSEDDALAVLLFCQKLAYDNDAVDFIEGATLGQVREELEKLSGVAANQLRQMFTKYDRREKNKRLIVSYPPKDIALTNRGKSVPNQIVVDEDMYADFLQIGGSPDVLCGAFIVDQEYEVETILANKDKYLERWQRRVGQIRQTNEQAKFDIMKRSIVNSLYAQLNEDFKQADGVDYDRHAIADTVTDYLSTVSPLAVNNPYPIILHIVSVLVFQNKHAERFLLDMEGIHQQSPDLDMREVAAQATFNYILGWVRSQIAIGK